MLLLIQILRQRSWPPFLFTSVRQPYTLLSPTAVVPNHQATRFSLGPIVFSIYARLYHPTSQLVLYFYAADT